MVAINYLISRCALKGDSNRTARRKSTRRSPLQMPKLSDAVTEWGPASAVKESWQREKKGIPVLPLHHHEKGGPMQECRSGPGGNPGQADSAKD
jgi:hypothetical protein